jgi:CheY-like chemotaxis protein
MPYRILLVDDEPFSIGILEFCLRQRGHEVLYAGHGEEALAMIRQACPDAIVTDYSMPIMDGEEFATRLRADAATADIPLFMLTGKRLEMCPDLREHLRIEAMFAKPCNTEAVIAALEHALGATLSPSA